ncbi:MAG: SPFH/Band 7/PHB domain protein [Clostridiales Family XIII bacterium]|jgi:regulator of protease activity HflC (stomatin/prohibitin superfamily)|nr:SPFH/Band 7/PHB domain protein [Clostridiales Family XIII bacterium]
MSIPTFITVIILLIILVLILLRNVRVVPQAKAYVIERLGAYSGTWQTGLHFKIPLIDKISSKVSLKENVLDFPPQPVITKDNVTMEIDTVIYYQVTDPKLYTYGVEYPLAAIENLTATTLRNIIGDLELDESLTSREHINARMREVLDEATDPWGIKINRVEVKNITPPSDIQTAMEKQMRAERERRESILRAEGEKRSAILIAEGNKQAKILEAEANKEQQILEATGESEAILLVQKATADGIKMLVESQPNEPVVAIKSLEAFGKAANGRATKIIIPSNIQGLAGLATSLTELIKDDVSTGVTKKKALPNQTPTTKG